MRPALVAGAVLALALLGDSLLYAVLPTHAEDFGVGAIWLGVLLSVNRFVRLGAYGAIVRAFGRFGERRLVTSCALAAAATTLVYAFGGPALMLSARVVWGLGFAVLSLAAMSYAATGGGRELGAGRAVSQLGPVLSLVLGSWLVGLAGARGVFVVMAVVSLLALPLSRLLPERAAAAPAASTGRSRRQPTALRGKLLLFAAIHLAESALLTALATLLTERGAATADVVARVALLLAGRRIADLVVAPVLGRLADARPAGPVVALVGGTSIAALLLAVLGPVLAATWVLVLARVALAAVGPLALVRRMPDDKVRALAAWSTWTETGSAIGPLAAGVWCSQLSPRWLLPVLAASILLTMPFAMSRDARLSVPSLVAELSGRGRRACGRARPGRP